MKDFIANATVDYDALETWEIIEIFGLDEEQEEILNAALEAGFDVENAVNIIQNGEYRFFKGCYSYAWLGEEILADKLEGDEFLKHLAPFINYERYGFAYCSNNFCYFTKNGVLEVF